MVISKNQISEAKRIGLFKKIDNIKAKRTGSIVILYFKKQKKANFSFCLKTKGKKRKGSLVNYRSFAITIRYGIFLPLLFHSWVSLDLDLFAVQMFLAFRPEL